ncbi:hypothetical protein LOZ57_006873 [Ophidiomyces ophidiicola]|uniref:uncharacterized protein n=1 Tax=Ophidiomyces ophidiicola TaxID=1387563 RepID=UPI0020C21510|nr:uncharacterized protein LOZ57_006873 [Ophidiomyces ophidiicola]KAI1935735.1 hypothetical protein LOZ57_006873 [Ophidiomyces ophidiicola]KAI2047936.1 hypothetical protein LOZ43_005511 [Ophidiomyces ophidiicola]KAI2081169.1 hypothetical protein LOZ36_006283 [Ophidiomyces ophidiicola]
MASNPKVEELKARLLALAKFLSDNNETLSTEECRNCYRTLPDLEKTSLKRLTQTPRRRREKNDRSVDKSADVSGRLDSTQEGAGYESQTNDSEERTDASETSEAEGGSTQKTIKTTVTQFQRRLPEVSTVEIPSPLHAILERCQAEGPRPFLKPQLQCLSKEKGLVAAFYRLDQSEGVRDALVISRRFYLHSFYVSIVKQGYHSGKQWRRGASNSLSKVIGTRYPSLGSIAEIKNKLCRYVEIGRGYDAWVTELGNLGCLIALPLGVYETEYTNRQFRKYIPQEAQRLRELGLDKVVKTSNLQPIGEAISKKLQDNFRPSKAYFSNKRTAESNKERSQKRRQGRQTNSTAPSTHTTKGIEANYRQRRVQLSEPPPHTETWGPSESMSANSPQSPQHRPGGPPWMGLEQSCQVVAEYPPSPDFARNEGSWLHQSNRNVVERGHEMGSEPLRDRDARNADAVNAATVLSQLHSARVLLPEASFRIAESGDSTDRVVSAGEQGSGTESGPHSILKKRPCLDNELQGRRMNPCSRPGVDALHLFDTNSTFPTTVRPCESVVVNPNCTYSAANSGTALASLASAEQITTSANSDRRLDSTRDSSWVNSTTVLISGETENFTVNLDALQDGAHLCNGEQEKRVQVALNARPVVDPMIMDAMVSHYDPSLAATPTPEPMVMDHIVNSAHRPRLPSQVMDDLLGLYEFIGYPTLTS